MIGRFLQSVVMPGALFPMAGNTTDQAREETEKAPLMLAGISSPDLIWNVSCNVCMVNVRLESLPLRYQNKEFW